MTKKQAKSLTLGVFRLYWKSGGSSVAAVGMDRAGERWMAPSNWISVPSYSWHRVKSAELIEEGLGYVTN